MFTTYFDKYACPGDTISCVVDGFTCTARIERDDNSGAPWQEHDGHGPVSEWTTRPKRPGERVLNVDRGSKRFYDFAAAVEAFKRECEPLPDKTVEQQAVENAESDFRYLKAWCEDEWFWCGICVQISKAGVDLTGDYDHALWGIECNVPEGDNTYLCKVANDLLSEALNAAKAKLAKLATETGE